MLTLSFEVQDLIYLGLLFDSVRIVRGSVLGRRSCLVHPIVKLNQTRYECFSTQGSTRHVLISQQVSTNFTLIKREVSGIFLRFPVHTHTYFTRHAIQSTFSALLVHIQYVISTVSVRNKHAGTPLTYLWFKTQKNIKRAMSPS